MSGYGYLRLNRSSENQIRSFYESIPTSGDVHFSLNREPGFFDALEVEGNNSDVFVMQKKDTGEIICSVIVSEKKCYINSKNFSIGYISSLRLAEQYRKCLLGFFMKAFYQHQQLMKRKISLISIFNDNAVAKKNLLTGKGFLPIMKDIGMIHTLIFKPLNLSVKDIGSDVADIRFASVNDIPMIIDFFDKYGKDKTFFPCYETSHLNSSTGLLKNLRMEDVALAFKNNELKGVMGLWNQTDFRNWKVHTYSFRLRLLKPFMNIISWIAGKALFPDAGKLIDYRCLSLVCIINNVQSVFNQLLNYQIVNLSGRRNVYFAYSMHDSCPFLYNFPIPNFDLKSSLYLTYWKEDEELVSSFRIDEIYLETGGL